MNLALAQSACLLRHRRLLRGGQASTSLKHDLSRATNDLGTLLRSCDWIHSVVEPCPSFFEQPLFGQCLTEFPFDFEAAPDEVTSTSHEHASPKSPRLRQKQAKPKLIQRGAVLSSRTARNSPTQDSVPGQAEISSTHSALSLPRRADPGLLQRKAGSVFQGRTLCSGIVEADLCTAGNSIRTAGNTIIYAAVNQQAERDFHSCMAAARRSAGSKFMVAKPALAVAFNCF